MHTLSPVAFVWFTAPRPEPWVTPELAAKFHPVAAVVPPLMPVVPVPHVAPVPEMRATLLAAAVTRLSEQMRTWRPETPVTISVVVAVETLTLAKLSQTAKPVTKPPVAPEVSPPTKSARAGGAAPVAPEVSGRMLREAAVGCCTSAPSADVPGRRSQVEPSQTIAKAPNRGAVGLAWLSASAAAAVGATPFHRARLNGSLSGKLAIARES